MPLTCTVSYDISRTFDTCYFLHFVQVKMQIVYLPVAIKKPYTHKIPGPLTFNRCTIVAWQLYIHWRPWQQRYCKILHHVCSNKNTYLAPTPFFNSQKVTWQSCDILGKINFTYLWLISLSTSVLWSRNVFMTLFIC